MFPAQNIYAEFIDKGHNVQYLKRAEVALATFSNPHHQLLRI